MEKILYYVCQYKNISFLGWMIMWNHKYLFIFVISHITDNEIIWKPLIMLIKKHKNCLQIIKNEKCLKKWKRNITTCVITKISHYVSWCWITSKLQRTVIYTRVKKNSSIFFKTYVCMKLIFIIKFFICHLHIDSHNIS